MRWLIALAALALCACASQSSPLRRSGQRAAFDDNGAGCLWPRGAHLQPARCASSQNSVRVLSLPPTITMSISRQRGAWSGETPVRRENSVNRIRSP